MWHAWRRRRKLTSRRAARGSSAELCHRLPGVAPSHAHPRLDIWCSRWCSSKRRRTAASHTRPKQRRRRAGCARCSPLGAASHKLEVCPSSASAARRGRCALRVTGTIFQLGCTGFASGRTALATPLAVVLTELALYYQPVIGPIAAWNALPVLSRYPRLDLMSRRCSGPSDRPMRWQCAPRAHSSSLLTLLFGGLILLHCVRFPIADRAG